MNPLVRTGLPVMLLAVICAVIITVGHHFTRDRIAENRRQETLHIVRDVMPLEYDNDLLADRIAVDDFTAPAESGSVSVYRARRGGRPVGVVLMPVPARGYNGRIELAVGIAYDGTCTGLRARSHRETKGIGDAIDVGRSDWVRQFDGLSLAAMPAADWSLRTDGGKLDQISGATITSRGVANAVHRALEYYDRNRDSLYE